MKIKTRKVLEIQNDLIEIKKEIAEGKFVEESVEKHIQRIKKKMKDKLLNIGGHNAVY